MSDQEHSVNDLSVSRLYQSAPADQPPAFLDKQIRQAARQQHKLVAHRPWVNWFRQYTVPLSLAATLVLGFSLVFDVLFSDQAGNNLLLTDQAYPADSQSPGLLPKKSMSALQKSRHVPAEVWLQRLEELLDQQQIQQAEHLYQQFQREFPDYTMPDALIQRLHLAGVTL